MSRALVLGGGGPVGIGWQAGLAVGLSAAGVDLARADVVVGTSAGSVVGAQLAAGEDMRASIDLLGTAGASVDTEANEAASAGLQRLMALVGEAALAAAADPVGRTDPADRAEEARARLGRLALDAPTGPEARYLEMFADLAGRPWPDRFACTAVDTATGTFRLWDRGASVELVRAVASSCAVPTIFPPVTIGGARYMDGGMRDMVNADVAAGHDTVLAVSCTLLSLPEGLGDPTFEAVLAGTLRQIEGLRAGGSVVDVITPGDEFLEVSEWGLQLMDFTRARAAYEAGVRQGGAEADRLSVRWAA